MRLEVAFEPPPGSETHLIVFTLVALSRGSGLPIRQAEKPEDALEGILRVFEEVFTLQHEQLVSVEVPLPLQELINVDAPREVGVPPVLGAVVALVGE